MNIEGLSKRVSLKTGDSPSEIEEAYRSMFKFMLEHFRTRDSRAINCIHLGKFLKNKSYDEFGNSNKKRPPGLDKLIIQKGECRENSKEEA